MKRALRITHFDKNKKAKSLELFFDTPSLNDRGYAEEGSLLLSIQSEDNKSYFQLSVSEASLLKERLEFILSLLSHQYIQLEEKVAKDKQKREKDEEGEKSEEDQF